MKKDISILLVIGAMMVALLFVVNILKKNASIVNPSEEYELLVLRDTVDNTWYYEIHRHEKRVIKQAFVPGLPKKVPFTAKEQAEKVGQLVLFRLQHGEPPVINNEDLEQLKMIP